MGKKNFVDKYNPFEAQIQRDAAKLTDKAEADAAPAAVAPAAKVPPVAPPATLRAAPLAAPARPTLPFDDEEEPEAPLPPRAVASAPRPAEALPQRTRPAAPPRPVDRTPGRDAGRPPPAADRTEVSPRLKVSQAAFQDLETALNNFQRATGSQIHYSIATRALWGLLIQAEAQVLEEFRKHPLGRLPSTRDKLAYAEYEERVKQVFAQAFRKLPRTLFQPVMNQEAGET